MRAILSAASRETTSHCTATLWQEIRAPGYPGGYSSVRDYLARFRGNAPAPAPAPKPPKPRPAPRNWRAGQVVELTGRCELSGAERRLTENRQAAT
jgi:hypothetical protein